jgi:hypothetical protein
MMDNLCVETEQSSMKQTDTSPRSDPESNAETPGATSGREYRWKAVQLLRRGVRSGAVTAIIGGAGLLGGLRALRSGERERGLIKLAFGAVFLAAALTQRRSRSRGGEPDAEETDVVDAGSDVESVADEAGDAGEEEYAAGQAAMEVTDTSPDIMSDETTTAEKDTDAGGGTQTEDIDRLGEAAFDRQSREVPAPQRAFNQGFLAHSAEAFWGIRTRDDAVLVSQDYDAIEDRNGVQYVASSEVGQDVRELPIPDAILDHWDVVIDGGTAVTGGDDILFVTTDDLAADGVLRVLPAEWADDLSEQS